MRRALAPGRPDLDAFVARFRPALKLDLSAGIATIATGVLLLLAEGAPRPRAGIVAGFFLALARLGVLASVRGSFWTVVARLRDGREVPADDPAVRRIAMLSGVAHALWLLALAAMVFPV